METVDILRKFEQKMLGLTGPLKEAEINEFFQGFIKAYNWNLIARMGEGEHRDDTWDYLYTDDMGIEIILNPNIKGFSFRKTIRLIYRLASHEFSPWDFAYEDCSTHFEKNYMKFREMVEEMGL